MRPLPLIPTIIASIVLLTLGVLGLVAAARVSLSGVDRGGATAHISFLVAPDGSLVGLTEDDARRAEAPIRLTISSSSGQSGIRNWRVANMSLIAVRDQMPNLSGRALIERAAADPAYAAQLEQMLRFAATDPIASIILSNHPELPVKGEISQRSLHVPGALRAAAFAAPAMLALATAVWLIVTLRRQYRVVLRHPAPPAPPAPPAVPPAIATGPAH